jgi:delta1-piperideine-2-carboxylate reductase
MRARESYVNTVHLSLDELFDLATRGLVGHGCDSPNAAAVARSITAAERDGCAAHGLFRLPGYLSTLASGRVNGGADPRLHALAPGVLAIDGDNGFAPLALERAIAPLAERGREQGIAALALTNTHHFAALWIEVEALCDRGLAAIAMTGALPSVAPAGTTRPFFGTNPMAFGWPRTGGVPMVFDQASSVRAKGEVMIAARDGYPLPPDAGLDAAGRPTTEPVRVLDGGALLPFGGYKGSAIALMVELLSGGLIGEAFAFEAALATPRDGGPARGGELLIALDPARFGDPQGWEAHCAAFFQRLEGLAGVRLPGERRHRNRTASLRDGVTVPTELYRQALKLAGLPSCGRRTD